MNPKFNEEKQKFQVDRIAFFSDAVFAIAITLMIIEVKPPHLEAEANNAAAIEGLLHVLPMFVGVAISFVFIGIFWFRHHQLFKHIVNYDNKLIGYNLFLLLSIIFIPFSTAFNFENSLQHTIVPLLFYNINYIVSTLATYLLFKYALNPSNGLCSADAEEDHTHLFRELMFSLVVFTMVVVLSFFVPRYAPLGYIAFGLQGIFYKNKKAVQVTSDN